MTKKIVTAALPYVNNQPHLGNIVGCVLSGDVYARYCRKVGHDTVYICGTDEYGTAIEMAAIQQNKTPTQICEENRIIHKQIYDWFDINFDYFGATTSVQHTKMVQEIFHKIYKNNFFNQKTVEQFYCSTCEIFLADRYINGTCSYCEYDKAKGDQCDLCGHTYKSTELKNPVCALCNKTPIIETTDHLFFSFDGVKSNLQNLYETRNQYWSENSKQITKMWLEQDLLPRCMTRDLKYMWGVKVPLANFEKKVFYVWFDAVLGYYTFLKECVKENYNKWIAEGEIIQFMGKDNVFFHSIVLPSLIYACDMGLPIVQKISATEFLMYENKKFSKSNGHGIFGLDLVDDRLGPSCLWRYYLIKIRPETSDSSFSFKHFVETVDADLNDNIGNLCNRVLKFINSKCNKIIKVEKDTDMDLQLVNRINNVLIAYHKNFEDIKLREALTKVLEISKIGNEFVQQVVTNKTDMKHGFSIAYSVIHLLAHLIDPFVPRAAKRLMTMCNINDKRYPDKFVIIKDHVISGEIVPLFNKLDESTLEKIKRFAQ